MIRQLGLGALLAVGLSGCSFVDSIIGVGDQTSKTVTVQTVIDACDAFQVALQGATVARAAKALPPAAISTIDGLIPQVQKICPPSAQMPSGPVDALVTVVTTTAQIIAVTKGGQ